MYAGLLHKKPLATESSTSVYGHLLTKRPTLEDLYIFVSYIRKEMDGQHHGLVAIAHREGCSTQAYYVGPYSTTITQRLTSK